MSSGIVRVDAAGDKGEVMITLEPDVASPTTGVPSTTTSNVEEVGNNDDVVLVVVVAIVVVVVVVVVVVLEVVEGVVVHVGCALVSFNVSGFRRFLQGHSLFGLEHVSITTRVSVPPQSEPSAFVLFHSVKSLYV